MPESRATLNAMAEEIFELYRVIAFVRSRQPSGPDDLSETEFLTLDILSKDQPLTIGEIQKRIGVVPAQMSRIVRALEEHGGRGYVVCNINAEDRRRVNVSLTKRGASAHEKYKVARLESMHAVLDVLKPDDRTHFMRILRAIRERFESRIEQMCQ